MSRRIRHLHHRRLLHLPRLLQLLRLLLLNLPLLAFHGTDDACVNPSQSALIVDVWAKKTAGFAPGMARKVTLEGDHHGVQSSLPQLLAAIGEMLPGV